MGEIAVRRLSRAILEVERLEWPWLAIRVQEGEHLVRVWVRGCVENEVIMRIELSLSTTGARERSKLVENLLVSVERARREYRIALEKTWQGFKEV